MKCSKLNRFPGPGTGILSHGQPNSDSSRGARWGRWNHCGILRRNVCRVCSGRATAHEAEEEMGYSARVNQSKIDYGSICTSSSIVQTGLAGTPSMKMTRRRDPNRFSRILESRRAEVGQKRLHVEVVSLVAIPQPEPRNAMLSRPRRPKGVPKARRASG